MSTEMFQQIVYFTYRVLADADAKKPRYRAVAEYVNMSNRRTSINMFREVEVVGGSKLENIRAAEEGLLRVGAPGTCTHMQCH
jgi:hypothetical protein